MLKGERVVLRSIEKEDLPLLCQFNNDLAVELAGGGDPPIPQALSRLQAEYDQNAQKGGRDGAWFAIEADGKLIGQCALPQIETVHRTCMLGIGIGDKEYWGRGYGREAVKLLVHYAFHYYNLNKVWLTVMSVNERAIRCYQACGFIEEGRLKDHLWCEGQFVDLVHMRILRSEWQ